MSQLCDRFKGALLGTHVGDSLGMPVEGMDYHVITRKYQVVDEMHGGRLPAGSFTDDTQMMLAVGSSLLRCRGFSGEDMAKAFLENYEPHRGYGPGTRAVLKSLRAGVPWNQAGKQVFNGGSWGNGAAMRVAPIACLYCNRREELMQVVREASAITHTHPLAQDGSLLLAFGVAQALEDKKQYRKPEDFLQALAKQSQCLAGEYRQKLDIISSLLKRRVAKKEEPQVGEVVKLLGNGYTALDSVPTALYAFLYYWGSFSDTLVNAVGLGGDTDTIGAMAGALAGAWYGCRQIPSQWLERLEGREQVEEMALALWELNRNLKKKKQGGSRQKSTP